MPRDRYSEFLADPLVEETFESEARLDGTENAFLERSYGENLYVPEVLKNEEYSDSPDVLFRERINLERQRRVQLRQAEAAFQDTNEREKFRKALSESVSAWSKNIPGGGIVSTFVDFSVFMDRMLSLPRKAVEEFGLKSVAGTLELAMSMPPSPGVGAPGLRRPELIEKAKQPFDEDPLLKSIELSIENLAEDYGVSPTYAASTFGKFTSMATQLGAGIGISLANPTIAATVFSSSSYKEAVDIYDEFAENPNPEDRMKAGFMVAIPTLIATRLGGEASIAKFLTKMTPSTRKQLLGQVLGNSLKEAAGEQGELLAMRFMMNRMTSLDVDYLDEENLTNAIISLVAAGGFQSGKLFSGMSGNLKSVLDGENFSQRAFKQLTRNIDQAEFTSGIENPAIKAIAVEAFNGNVEAQQTLSSLFDLDQLHAKKKVVEEPDMVESIKSQPESEIPELLTVGEGEVKLAQEQIKLDRENLGLEEMDGPTKRKWQNLNAQAKEQRLDLRAMDLVNELEKSPRVITDLEHSSLLIKEADLRNKYDEALDQTRELQDQGKFEQSAVLNKKADDILVDIDRLLIASAKSGTEAGRALAARRMSVSRDDFSVTNMTIVAKANKKSDLTLEEKEQIKQVSKQVNDAKKEVDRVVKRNNEALRSGDPEADLPDSEFNSKVNREAKLNKNSKTRSRVKLLEKELEVVRQRFVDKESPKEVEKRKPTKKEQELLDKIAFYKKGEAEAGRIAVLEEKLERFSNLEKKGDIESIRQEVGKPPKWVSKKEVETYENKLKNVVNKKRKRLRKKVSDADKQNLETELAGAYAGYKIEAKKARKLQESYLKWTVGRIWNEAGSALPRALMVTGDAGAVFRQGLIASVRRPGVAAKSQVKAFASALSERKFFEIDSMLKEVDPEAHALRDQSGLYLSDISQRGLNSREEAFTSTWIENIPVIKHVAAASERHMTTTLNQLRAGAFDQFVAKHPNSTLEQRKAYANFINNASGRGSLGSLERSINGLNKVFFAPRYAASRFTAPILPAVYLAKKSTRLAGREALYDWAALIGIASTVLALADVAGADVSYDVDSPDFLKIRIGNTRIDFLAGIAQSVRMMAMGPKAFIERQLNEDNRENLFTAYSRFFTYKLSPGVTIPITAMGGANVIGQEQDLVDQAISALPLVYTEAYQVWQNEDSLSLGAATAGLGFFGIGIQNY
jgi:hypothetical protein